MLIKTVDSRFVQLRMTRRRRNYSIKREQREGEIFTEKRLIDEIPSIIFRASDRTRFFFDISIRRISCPTRTVSRNWTWNTKARVQAPGSIHASGFR